MSSQIDNKISLGQFFTPDSICQYMVSLFQLNTFSEIRLLDPGAGTGNLSCAFMEFLSQQKNLPSSVYANCYEIDSEIVPQLKNNLFFAEKLLDGLSVHFESNIIEGDFIETTVHSLSDHLGLFKNGLMRYTHCIINPPYKKISSNSYHAYLLREIGLETPNYYSAFVAIAVLLLESGGEIVAILPRSFCNGVYFTRFRKFFLENMSLRHIHVFESRKNIFDNNVLQENIILHAVKRKDTPMPVTLSFSRDASFQEYAEQKVAFSEVIHPDDKACYIHIPVRKTDAVISQKIKTFRQTLDDLGISVCTGPVVDFRLVDFITTKGECPLIYPRHFENGRIKWPKYHHKKTDRIFYHSETKKWLMANQ
ncbi:MAG: Eco57I restriction-modification methylase domain-containing protein [Planctomycetaceae bacterium]|jgi:adenine-specific DNA-methyltransferase|nr:Eco57I restriction-modification methylase domain-containing protein [Planctomycetaceae bacterium]